LKTTVCVNEKKISRTKSLLNRRFDKLLYQKNLPINKVLEWINDYFSFVNDLSDNSEEYLSNTSTFIEDLPNRILLTHPILLDCDVEWKDYLTEDEMIEIDSYQLYKDEKMKSMNILSKFSRELKLNFYSKKFPKISNILLEAEPLIPTLAKNDYKTNLNLFMELHEFMSNGNKGQKIINNSFQITKQPICPFTDDVKELFFYLQKKNPPLNKIHFSYIYVALTETNTIKKGGELKKNYFAWVNMLFTDFKGPIEYHSNTNAYDKIDILKELINDYQKGK
jgi:hypothetical protein